jgi:dienelactone hydrolase
MDGMGSGSTKERLVMKLTVLLVMGGLACIARAGGNENPGTMGHGDLMRYLDPAGLPKRVENATDWEKRRVEILQNMQKVMGTLPDEKRKVALDLRVEETAELEGYTRKKITFAVEKGDRLPAYLLIPKNLHGKTPAVLCLHQTTKSGKGSPAGIDDRPSLHYAVELARRGYVTLAPDYPYFGDNKSDPYKMGYQSATMKGLWDHMRCVDLLQSLDEVDGERIGCIGHSLGGHNTMFLAAFDVRIKAAVSSCGFTSFAKYYGGNLTGWSSEKYMPRIASVYGKDPAKMPFDFPEVVAAIAPRAFMTASPVKDANFEVSGVRDCIAAAKPVYELLRAKEKLVAIYPEGGHDFGEEARKEAYLFLDRWLKEK